MTDIDLFRLIQMGTLASVILNFIFVVSLIIYTITRD